MRPGDAEITDIPALTKTEEIDSDMDTMKDIFKDEDISRLDLQFKRNRKIQVTCIEEYLKTLEFKPFEDGDTEDAGPDLSRGVFKKGYKMRIVEEAEEMSPTRESAKSGFKKTQIGSVSTKSNFRRAEETGMKLQLAGSTCGTANILHRYRQNGVGVCPAASKIGDRLAFSEKACQAKVFTTRHKITRVEVDESSLSSATSGRDLFEQTLLPTRANQPEPLDEFPELEFSSLLARLQDGVSDTYSLPKAAASVADCLVFGVANGMDELLLLEFAADSEVEGQSDLVSVHVCYLVPQAPGQGCPILDRIELSTRQDGFCSMRKFVSKLLDVPFSSASPPLQCCEARDIEVKSLRLEECSPKSIEFGEGDSRRKQSNSAGHKNSIADLTEDQFFEDDHYFQARKREKVYQAEGSFSL